MKRIQFGRAGGLLLLLLLLLIPALGACGEIEPEVGTYLCAEILDDGLPLAVPESRLVFDRGGYGRLERGDEGGAIHWRREGDGMELTVDGEVLIGTWDNGVIRFETPEGLTMVFAREDLAADYLAAAERRRATVAAQQSLWKGDWYGWWRIDKAEGALADTWYDLCARLTAQPDESMHLLLWDEDQSAEEPMAEARLFFNEDDSATAADGYFWLLPLQGAEWTMRYADGRLTLTGHYEAEGDSFDYSLCLRPWGELWMDENEQPYYYDSWYLPLIQAEESMPDHMDIEKLK